MQTISVYDRYRGTQVHDEVRSFLDCFRLKAVQNLTSLGKQDFEGERRIVYVVDTTYTCRIPMPKYVRKAYMGFSIQEKQYLSDLFSQMAIDAGMVVSDKGYQPYSGWLELEYTEIDALFTKETMKFFYKRAYAVIKKFKRNFKPRT